MENKNRKSEIKKRLVEATSKVLGAATSELGSKEKLEQSGSTEKVQQGGRILAIGEYEVNFNNEKSESKSWFTKIADIKTKIVSAFRPNKESKGAIADNLKLMDREVYSMIGELSQILFDDNGHEQESDEIDNLKQAIKEKIVARAEANKTLNNSLEVAGGELDNIEKFVDDLFNSKEEYLFTVDKYLAKLDNLNSMITDQRYLDTLHTAVTGTRGFMANAIALGATKGLVGAGGIMAVPVVALLDGGLKASVDTAVSNVNIDRRDQAEDEALNQEVNYLLSPKEGLGNPEDRSDIPLFALQKQFLDYQNDKLKLNEELKPEGAPGQDEKIIKLEKSANELLAQSHQFIQFYYDLETKVLSQTGKLSASNYYSYQALGEFVDNLINAMRNDGLFNIKDDVEANRRILSAQFLSNQKKVKLHLNNYTTETGDSLALVYSDQEESVGSSSQTVNMINKIGSEERLRRAREVIATKEEAAKEVWSIKNLSKTALLSVMSSTFTLLAKGVGAIAAADTLQGKQLIGVDQYTRVFSGAAEQTEQYMRLQAYIQNEAHQKLYDALSPEWSRAITERLGIDKGVQGATKWLAKNYAKYVVENQNAILNTLPEAVKEGFQNLSPVDAQFRAGLDMGANGSVHEEFVKQGARSFNLSREFDFGAKVPYAETIKNAAKGLRIGAVVGSIISALPILINKAKKLQPTRVDTAKVYPNQRTQTAQFPKKVETSEDNKTSGPQKE